MLTIAQKKHRHVSFVDQKEAPSSREKSTPPMGAPKAAATPAAAPQATKSLRIVEEYVLDSVWEDERGRGQRERRE